MVRLLSAIMFTDMVGYTALMQQDEARAKAQRDRQRRVLESRIEEHGGRILQFYGDGTLSVFQSAVQAVRAAMAVQTDLGAEPRVPLRIGIHTGDIVHDDEGVFGDGVNVAARVQSLATPGSILVSDKLFDEVKNQSDIQVVSLGQFDLKNVTRHIGVYAITNDGLTRPHETELADARAMDPKSVAVLPFVNMSSDAENEFFADGISEEIINALTRVEGLQVTARTSSFAFKGKNDDIREIANRLAVKTVLEGSVRRAGNRVRIAAQLINAEDGYHLFSDVYDRPLDDIFATQDEIARTIVEQLQQHLDPEQHAASPVATPAAEPLTERPHTRPLTEIGSPIRPHTHDTEAYTEYLKGRFHWNKWNLKDAQKAIVHLERSAELDPSCSLPFSALAMVYCFLASIGQLPADDAYPRAAAYAREALALEGEGGEGHLALGVVKVFYDWDFTGAEEAFRRALDVMPGSADAHHLYGMFLKAVGRHDESVEHLRTAGRIDPLSLPLNQALVIALFAGDRVDEAEAILHRSMELNPDFRATVEADAWLRVRRGDLEGAAERFERMTELTGDPRLGAAQRGFVYGRLGRTEDALAMLGLLREREKAEPGQNLRMDYALLYWGLGDLDETFRHLNAAVDERIGIVIYLKTSPNWKPLQSDPRFAEVVARIGLPETAPV